MSAVRFVTVHGTADEPSVTDEKKWWEPNSEFQNNLASELGAEGVNSTFIPFQWSGLNSEVARREAGTRLRAFLRELPETSDRTVLIGHSHGGSVIAEALHHQGELGAKMRPLAISIGTPFIQFKKQLLSLPGIQKALLGNIKLHLTLVLFSVVFAFCYDYLYYNRFNSIPIIFASIVENFSMYLTYLLDSAITLLNIQYYVTVLIKNTRDIGLLLVFFIFFSVLVRFFLFLRSMVLTVQIRDTMSSSKNIVQTFDWINIYHQDDEAINALRVAARVEARVFRRFNFAQALSSLANISSKLGFFAFVVTFGFVCVYPLLDSLGKFLRSLSAPIPSTVREIVDYFVINVSFGAVPLLILVSFFLFIFSSILNRGVEVFQKQINILFEYSFGHILDFMISRNTRSLALGEDIAFEIATRVSHKPNFNCSMVCLEGSPCTEVVAIANENAASTVGSVRNTLTLASQAGFSDQNVWERLYASLTTRDLVHTAYFYSPAFTKLIAKTIVAKVGQGDNAETPP